MTVRMSSILRDTSIQCRATIDVDLCTQYAEAMTDGAEFPPVELYGDESSGYYIADGWHRIAAADHCGWLEIDANVHPGGRVDALKHALQANAIHGARRSNADKRRAVEIAVKEFSGMSSREIARMCGVSDALVGSARPQVQDSCTSRTGADGKSYPAKRPVTKREIEDACKPEPEAPEPDAAPEAGSGDDITRTILQHVAAAIELWRERGAEIGDDNKAAIVEAVQILDTEVCGE